MTGLRAVASGHPRSQGLKGCGDSRHSGAFWGQELTVTLNHIVSTNGITKRAEVHVSDGAIVMM